MFRLRHVLKLRSLVRIFAADRTPHQLALAVALGMLVGVLPKGNLLTLFATVLLFGLRVNLGTGLATAFLISLAGSDLDRLTHGIGVRVLQTPAVYEVLRRGHQLPLIPWTSMNNTVVVGSLVLGLLLLYPTYHISRLSAEALIPRLRRFRRRRSLAIESASME